MTGESFTVTVALTGLLLLFAGQLGRMDKWLAWSWLQGLGLVSYSLYLLHNPLTGAMFRVVGKWLPGGILSELISLVLTLGVCLLGSWMAYLWIERPSIGWSHRIVLGKLSVPDLSAQGI